MDHPHLADILDPRHVESFGKKGAGLHWLARQHLTIPRTLVLTYSGARKINASAPQVRLGRGAASLREEPPREFEYPSKKAFYEELTWLLW